MRPYTMDGVYLNMTMDEGERRVRVGYAPPARVAKTSTT
jgi:hypothetical protein